MRPMLKMIEQNNQKGSQSVTTIPKKTINKENNCVTISLINQANGALLDKLTKTQ